MNWKLGDTSRKYEVGCGGPGTVSTGIGDHGGVSYGLYQLSSKTGTCSNFVLVSGLTFYFGQHEPGSPEFTKLWKLLAKDDETFGDIQHEYIKKTHFDTQISQLQSYRIDFLNRGPSVKDMVWSTSVQFGGKTNLIRKALNTFEPDDLLDYEIVTIVQDYKIRNNQRLFRSSSESVRRSTLRRAENEKRDLVELSTIYPSRTIEPKVVNSDEKNVSSKVNHRVSPIETNEISKGTNKTWWRSFFDWLTN